MKPILPKLSILRESWTDYRDTRTTQEVEVHGVSIGGPIPVVIAGPCAVESLSQTLEIARTVQRAGGHLLRGGSYKPRTNPHSFQGLGHAGLEILAEVRDETGLGIVTEVLDPRRVEEVADYADMLQIGSRSMQNFPLLTEVGRTNKPILLKRGWSATLEEWLCAAEYIAQEGNTQIVLCERGIRTSCHGGYANSILDLNVIEPVREATPLPIIVDPSHSAGGWSLVAALGRAAVVSGSHGLLVEVVESETQRASVRCDAEQGVPPEALGEIIAAAQQAVPAGRQS